MFNTQSVEAATAGQIALCKELVEAGANQKHYVFDSNMTRKEANIFIKTNSHLDRKVRSKRVHKRRVAHRLSQL